MKNNLADNHLEMTLIKAELAELRSENETRQPNDQRMLDDSDSSGYGSENIQRQLQLL